MPGGFGGRTVALDSGQFTLSGGGQNSDTSVGGSGEHTTCDASGCTSVGSFPHGLHQK